MVLGSMVVPHYYSHNMSSENIFVAAGIRSARDLGSALVEVVFGVAILLWEVGIFLYNLTAKPLEEGKVVPKGHLRANGNWPELWLQRLPIVGARARC